MGKRWLTALLIPFLLFYAFPVEAVEKEERTWQDEVIYFIMVDRFNNGDQKNDLDADPDDPRAYHGGDLQGITDKLDYLKGLGATALWLTPIVDNEDNGYHGYWTKDFYKVDEHFGTMEDLQNLVKEAHKRDIKIILDLVVNHTGYQHPWLNDPEKQDWFHERKDITNFDNQDEVENGWLAGLPDLAQENDEVREYLLDVATYWIKEADIDGYRLDTVKHVPKSFWEDFSKEVKSVKQDFFLIGEVWHNDPRYVASYNQAGIDALVDYPFFNDAVRIFREPDTKMEAMYNVWKRNQAYYEDPYLLGNFIDNHDNVRFVREAKLKKENPETRLKLALTYLYTAPGIPILYQGTEIAMDGGPDPDNRRMMNFRSNTEFVDFVKELGQARHDFPSLRRGDFELLYSEGGMAVFKRTYQDETTVIAVNNTSKTQAVVLPTEDLAEGKQLRGLLEEDLVKETEKGYELIIDREKANLYILEEKTGLNLPFITMLTVVYGAFVLFVIYIIRRRKKAGTQN